MEYEAGTSFSVTVDLGEVPEDGTLSYTIRQHDGSTLSGHTNQPLTSSQLVTVDFPSAITSITKTFEKRTLIFDYKHNGASKRVTRFIKLVPFINTVVTGEMVRDWFGLSESELDLSRISVFDAYMEVKKDIQGIDTFLSAGDETENAANNAVLARAAMRLIPSLKLLVAQSQTDGPIEFQRYSDIDFEAFEDRAKRLYDESLSALGRGEAEPDLFTVVQRPDAFVGG